MNRVWFGISATADPIYVSRHIPNRSNGREGNSAAWSGPVKGVKGDCNYTVLDVYLTGTGSYDWVATCDSL